jgi:hypothetical protein
LSDEDESEQKVAVKYEGGHVKLVDKQTQLVGKMDAEGRVHGEMIHDGVAGGSFVLTPTAAAKDGDEAGFLQLDIKKHESLKVQTLKAGSSYTGQLKHPSFPNEEFRIRLDLTSATDGRWRDSSDEDEA